MLSKQTNWEMLIQNVIVEFRSVGVRISKDVLAKRDKLVANRVCLVCEEPLGDKPSRRGECPTCRQYTTRKVERGLITENDLIRDGHLLERPTEPRGGCNKAHAKRAALLKHD